MLRILSRAVAVVAAFLALGCQSAVREAYGWSTLFQRSNGYGWSGGDAAYSVPLPGDRTLWLFGDSVLGNVESKRRKSVEFRFGNTIAIQRTPAVGQEPLQPENSLTFDWGAPDSSGWLPIFSDTLENASIPPSLEQAIEDGRHLSAWPLHGIVIGRDLLLFNAVATPASCDHCNQFAFEVHGSTASVIHGVDRPYEQWGVEHGAGWRVPPAQKFVSQGRPLVPPGSTPSLLWGTYVLADPTNQNAILVYGHRHDGASNELVVARVEPITVAEDALDFARWTFWDGRAWQTQPEAARGILANSAVEVSVVPVPELYGGGYAVVHGAYDFVADVRVAIAPSPLGPFEERYVFALADCPIAGFNPAKPPPVYAVKGHPQLSDDETLLVSLVLSPADAAPNVGFVEATDAYVPRFLELPWAEIMTHTHSSPDRCDM